MNFGVVIFLDKELIFQALPYSFASTAWIESDEVYNQISDSKFEAITGDDNCIYKLAKTKIRRLKSLEEFNNLLNSENTCESFRNQTIAWLNN